MRSASSSKRQCPRPASRLLSDPQNPTRFRGGGFHTIPTICRCTGMPVRAIPDVGPAFSHDSPSQGSSVSPQSRLVLSVGLHLFSAIQPFRCSDAAAPLNPDRYNRLQFPILNRIRFDFRHVPAKSETDKASSSIFRTLRPSGTSSRPIRRALKNSYHASRHTCAADPCASGNVCSGSPIAPVLSLPAFFCSVMVTDRGLPSPTGARQLLRRNSHKDRALWSVRRTKTEHGDDQTECRRRQTGGFRCRRRFPCRICRRRVAVALLRYELGIRSWCRRV